MKYRAASSLVSLILTIIIVLIGIMKNELIRLEFNVIEPTDEVLALTSDEYNVNEEIDSFINNNSDIFNFYSDTFEISLDDLKAQLYNDNKNGVFNQTDIGNKGIIYNTLDINLIDYLFNLEDKNPKLFNDKHINGNSYSKEYIYGLLSYYSSIYGNVDYKLLAGITYIETGNLNSTTMLKKNNIYGGMGSNGLLSYKNISYGVLQYVNLMSTKYYGIGLNTIESIGKKFNPVYTSKGNKVANPTWVSDIKSILYKINNNVDITSVDEILNLA